MAIQQRQATPDFIKGYRRHLNRQARIDLCNMWNSNPKRPRIRCVASVSRKTFKQLLVELPEFASWIGSATEWNG